ncbi:MAG TPA: MMPL family transporter, partial [Thermomicrobiaceae bacterium]|nr:MMPL family transporter [Thermomicrobiaceae bacterium]
MTTLTRWVLRHKLIVGLFWLAMLVVGGATVARATHALSESFSAPGEESYEANLQVIRTYGVDSNSSPVVLVSTLPTGGSFMAAAPQTQFSSLLDQVAKAVPGARILSYGSTRDRAFISADGRTTFALVYLPLGLKQGAFGGNGPTVQLIQRISGSAKVDGSPVHVTGIDALTAAEGTSGNGGPSLLVETLIGGAGALVVLAFVFGSFIAIVPLFMAAVAIMSAFLLVWGVTAITSVSFIVQFLIGLIGLGVAIDYSLLIIIRWREERAEGLDNPIAVERAMATAGHAVVFSGTAVGIGLLAMVALPIPALRSVGYGGLLIPLVSVAVATTLLPVVLATVGPRLDWPRLRSEAHGSRPWSAWAHFVVRRRWMAAIVAVVILGALFIPATQANPGNPAVGSLAKAGDAHDGLFALEDSGIGAGPLTPISILVKAGNPTPVIARVARVSGVLSVIAPDTADWRRAGTSLLTVIPTTDANSSSGHAIIDRVRVAAHAGTQTVGVTGDAVSSADFTSAVYANFPLMLGIIAVITF